MSASDEDILQAHADDLRQDQSGADAAYEVALSVAAEMTPAWAEYGHLRRVWDWLHLEKVDPQWGLVHIIARAYRRGMEDAQRSEETNA